MPIVTEKTLKIKILTKTNNNKIYIIDSFLINDNSYLNKTKKILCLNVYFPSHQSSPRYNSF